MIKNYNEHIRFYLIRKFKNNGIDDDSQALMDYLEEFKSNYGLPFESILIKKPIGLKKE